MSVLFLSCSVAEISCLSNFFCELLYVGKGCHSLIDALATLRTPVFRISVVAEEPRCSLQNASIRRYGSHPKTVGSYRSHTVKE